MPIHYKPKPGSTVSRVVELMRFLPSGTELRTSDFFARLEIKKCPDLAKQLAPAVEHGLLRREMRRVAVGSGRAVFWMAADRSFNP